LFCGLLTVTLHMLLLLLLLHLLLLQAPPLG
jgi:hypothetical protein